MDMWEWIVLALAIVAMLALVAAFMRIRQRRTHLKERFGPVPARRLRSRDRSSRDAFE